MTSHRLNKKDISLIALNGTLAFIIAFLIGGNIAGAQIPFFDEPAPKTSYQLDENSPYTAQFPEYKEQLSSTVTPENPGPGEQTEISLEIYSFDINSANITWKRNGVVVESGIGKKKFTFTNGASGVTTTIEATIDPKDRPIITETHVFTPNEVDLLWQAQTYTPPFFKGKTLFSPESEVLLVAFPKAKNGSIKPQETVFNWTENYNRQADKSGYGKNTYAYTGSIIQRNTKIAVDTHSPRTGSGAKETASNEVTLTPRSPGLLLYEDNPALGVLFNNALFDTITLNKPEIRISAYPYFQTASNKNRDLQFFWAIDGERVDVPVSQHAISLNRTNRQVGESVLQIQSENPSKILQTTAQALTIKFDDRTSEQTTQFGQ
jgi:hypothetical protein